MAGETPSGQFATSGATSQHSSADESIVTGSSAVSVTDPFSGAPSPLSSSATSPAGSRPSSPGLYPSSDPSGIGSSPSGASAVGARRKVQSKSGGPPSAALTIRSYSNSYGGSLASAFGSAGDAPKMELKMPKSEQTPQSVRFRPNIAALSGSSTGSTRPSPTRQSALTSVGGPTDLSALLAQSLRMNSSAEGPKNESAQLNRGFAGPPGARRNRGPMTSMVTEKSTKKGFKIAKEKKPGASKNLTEICWADDRTSDLSLYLPLSLPYIIKEDEEAEATPTSRRPTVRRVDEANRNVSAVFEPLSEELRDETGRDWYFVQFPQALPAVSVAAMERQRRLLAGEDPESDVVSSAPSTRQRGRVKKATGGSVADMDDDLARDAPSSTLPLLPEGYLGRLKLHQSGKVKLWLAGHSFNVNLGSECSFSQDVSCHIDSNSEFMFLGKCSKRVTIVPDIERMIDVTKPEFMKVA